MSSFQRVSASISSTSSFSPTLPDWAVRHNEEAARYNDAVKAEAQRRQGAGRLGYGAPAPSAAPARRAAARFDFRFADDEDAEELIKLVKAAYG
eukprot:CAMPEP_0182454246 /NCGR_PEP_ID=MMETSP1319-20130603/969_1 /TAXON_ID=172717 /ORGANISM="Bolidomonas pacifica, Strain RCC208" /LENGTH=93 /DNA_ID=CAMNT_0024652247 /DNA_START=15 /DNA_END=293 /DNA_ORIENTATION=-